jgi:hypothetical protein
MTAVDDARPVSLLRQIRSLRRLWWLIALPAVLLMALPLASGSRHRATAQLVAIDNSAPIASSLNTDTAFTRGVSMRVDADTVSGAAGEKRVSDAAGERVTVTATPNELNKLVSLTVTSKTAAGTDKAIAFAIDQVRQRHVDQVLSLVNAIKQAFEADVANATTRLAELDKQLADAGSSTALANSVQLERLSTSDTLATSKSRLAAITSYSATADESIQVTLLTAAVQDRGLTRVVFAGIIGLVLGLLAALGYDSARGSIRSVSELEQASGVPVLGVVSALGSDGSAAATAAALVHSLGSVTDASVALVATDGSVDGAATARALQEQLVRAGSNATVTATSSVLGAGGALETAMKSDAVVLLATASRTRRESVVSSVRVLRQAGLDRLAFVLLDRRI